MNQEKNISNEIRDTGCGFKIIKDMECDNLFYAVINKKEYDSENEWSIIASGKNEIEVMQNLLKKIYEKYDDCYQSLLMIGESLSYKSNFDISEKYYLESHHIEKEAYFGHQRMTSFSALKYDEETNKWNRFYR
jgi:hypothetical protein